MLSHHSVELIGCSRTGTPIVANTIFFLLVLIVRAFYVFCRILSNFELSDEDVRNKSDHVFASENSLPPMSTSFSAAKYRSAMELMKVFSYTSVACTRKSFCLGAISMCYLAVSSYVDYVDVPG